MLFPPRSFAAPPDGGWGWVVTVASFAVNFVIIGTTYSFGVLLSALVADPSLLAPGSHAAGVLVCLSLHAAPHHTHSALASLQELGSEALISPS